jgi:hypothetical protein
LSDVFTQSLPIGMLGMRDISYHFPAYRAMSMLATAGIDAVESAGGVAHETKPRATSVTSVGDSIRAIRMKPP